MTMSGTYDIHTSGCGFIQLTLYTLFTISVVHVQQCYIMNTKQEIYKLLFKLYHFLSCMDTKNTIVIPTTDNSFLTSPRIGKH